MECFGCRAQISLASGDSLGFRAECEGCGFDLHVCLHCVHHDPSAYNGCREPNAERVADFDRANRCDYFQPKPERDMNREEAGAPPISAREEALGDLERLFKKNE